MDYRELLRKYIQHVVESEGISFMEVLNAGGPRSVAFTPEEVAELKSLDYDDSVEDEAGLQSPYDLPEDHPSFADGSAWGVQKAERLPP